MPIHIDVPGAPLRHFISPLNLKNLFFQFSMRKLVLSQKQAQVPPRIFDRMVRVVHSFLDFVPIIAPWGLRHYSSLRQSLILDGFDEMY